jgi:heterodisulfide reductase subunit C
LVVRRTAADPQEADRLAHQVPPLLRCQQCGACGAVCPSQRHGGIRPAEVMARASVGSRDEGAERSLWQCARCLGCTERCPSDADPGEVIAQLRERAAREGAVPAFLADEAKRFIGTGMCFPRTGMTKKLRRELGLGDGEVSPRTMEEVGEIVRRGGLGRIIDG